MVLARKLHSQNTAQSRHKTRFFVAVVISELNSFSSVLRRWQPSFATFYSSSFFLALSKIPNVGKGIFHFFWTVFSSERIFSSSGITCAGIEKLKRKPVFRGRKT